MAGIQYDDRRNVSLRISGLQYTIAAGFAVLAVAFWIFQVAQHQKFAEMAENNHLRTIPVRAPRGVLFDRNGTVMVENRFSWTIALVREQTANLDQTIRILAKATGIDEASVREVIRRKRSEPSYRPIPIIEDASIARVAAVRARAYELPGVVIDQVPTRHYPDDDIGAHLFGYVGEISEAQLQRASNENITSGAIVGQAGLEQIYNDLLMGKDGAKYMVVNSTGREIRGAGDEQPVEGRRLQLTIDYDVQRAVEEGFRKSGYNGAAVILDPGSGEILSLVSLPAYDPNRFATGIDRATWASLNTDKLHPLQNRALQGRYSPGSTFKIAVATAALEEGVITPDFKVHCTGGATFYGRFFQCWKREGHGTVDLRQAIEQSCNTYFYTVGNMVGVDRIHKWATLLGLGEKSGVDLPHEVQGLVPSTEWKRRVLKEKWYAGETISVSIGQAQVSVTPIEMAVMMATIGNGGTRFTPHLLKAVDEGQGWKPVPAPPVKSTVALKPSTIAAIHDGLWMVVNGRGTGGRARIAGRDVSGKTGTAQVISLSGGRAAAGRTDKDLRDNGWFVFFAPRDNPEIAGVVFTEHSQHGSESAPIAKFAMETFFAKKYGQPLPVWPAAPGAVVAASAEPAEEPDAVPATPIRVP